MGFEHEKREALRLLQGIENGTLTTTEAARLIGDADPALVYFIVTWLRSHYGRNHPAAQGVLGRLVEVSASPGVLARLTEGKADPLVDWFEDAYGYRDFSAPDFVDLIVEKLEG